jgi:Xaa-Pro dipeptidase
LAQAHRSSGQQQAATIRRESSRPCRTRRRREIFLDLGPVFEAWEADFGRTFVLGDDPLKHKLRRDVETAFAQGKRHFEPSPDITAKELYEYAQSLAKEAGWEFGGPIAGHLIGQFPHERIPGDKVTLYVHPKNLNRMRDRHSCR